MARFDGVRVPLATTPPQARLTAPAKLLLVAEIASTYARVRWLMARNELPTAVARLRSGAAPNADSIEMPAFNRGRLAVAVVRVLGLIPADSRCLMRALVMLAMLRRRGVSATLVIGVRTEPKFAAHAWVEHDGQPLLPDGDGEYSPLVTL